MICAPVIARDLAEARASFAQAAKTEVDLLELRLDYFAATPDIAALIAESPRPVIVTCRPKREGGLFTGPEELRLAWLEEARRRGAAYLDIEGDSFATFRPGGRTRLIASYHNFRETPADLPRIVRELEALPCDIVKFAVMGQAPRDNLSVLAQISACRKPAIGLCMGEYGEASRVLAPRAGAILTFGSLRSGQESAPGQPTVQELIELYRVGYLTDRTELFAVVGDPIAHSLSPTIHNSAFSALGLDRAYLRFRVTDFPTFLRQTAEPLGLRGLSVTIPHKGAALAAAAEVDELARRVGAVNTLTRLPDGRWRGDNTDLRAALDAILRAAERCGLALADAPAVVLGAGGTSRALAVGLQTVGCRVTIANRTREKAFALAEELGVSACGLDELRPGQAAVIANTTSLGMYPRVCEPPLTAQFFRPGQVVFDAVYNPQETLFLRLAREQGAQVATGVEMFVGQAARQFELWTGQPAPVELMEHVILESLAARG